LGEISEAMPRGKACGELFSIELGAQRMSFEREVLSDRTEARQECLRTFGIAEATHAALAFTRRLMASMSRKLSQQRG
jgi:hypothetical protein